MPSAHWDASLSHGNVRYPHELDEAGNTVVWVPREITDLLHRKVAGYEICEG